MAIVKSNLEIILMNQDILRQHPDEFDRSLTVMNQELDRLGQLVTDLVEMAKIDAGQKEFHLSTVSLSEVIELVLMRMHVLSNHARINLKFVEDEDIKIHVDRREFEKVIDNLVTNAILYNREGGTVTVSVGRDEENAIIKVVDTGIGIAPHDIAHIFERFYRSNDVKKERRRGTGLGLSICKWIVERHGGRISVESVPREGTTFTISLPLTSY